MTLNSLQRTQKNESLILQALAATGQNELAKLMAVHESTISRLKDGGIHTMAAALAHLGLKVVPVGAHCFDPEYVSALKTLANVGMRQEAPALDWSDTA